MRFLSGVILGIFSAILILIQGLFITWSTAFPRALFYTVTIISIVLTIVLLVQSKSKDK